MPPVDRGFPRRLRLIKARLTQHLLHEGVNIGKDDRGEYELWQNHYWEHTIRDDPDFEAYVNYVHIIPVMK